MSHPEALHGWMKDAYAMEIGPLPLLESLARDAHDAALADKARHHLQRTHTHIDRVRDCLIRYGETPDSIAAIAPCEASQMPTSSVGAPDETLRNAVREFAAEHFQIAVYKAILVAAQAADDSLTLRMCEEILDDEEDMVRWLEDLLAHAE